MENVIKFEIEDSGGQGKFDVYYNIDDRSVFFINGGGMLNDKIYKGCEYAEGIRTSSNFKRAMREYKLQRYKNER